MTKKIFLCWIFILLYCILFYNFTFLWFKLHAITFTGPYSVLRNLSNIIGDLTHNVVQMSETTIEFIYFKKLKLFMVLVYYNN